MDQGKDEGQDIRPHQVIEKGITPVSNFSLGTKTSETILTA